ncbi:MAG TPA: DUF1501 domain-containing protein [Stellaceae bacterium]|nr:DUF1501 domain-containing protein [Stellaceae bacterium]
MRRRDFLWRAGGGLWAVRSSVARAAPTPRGTAVRGPQKTADGRKRLVVVMLRGAVDGLNVVVPHFEKDYYDARPGIAIGKPGTPDGALPLDTRFGLNPALASLMSLWREKQLAFVHAAGSPDPTRSHFDAQFTIESGTPGVHTTPDGWMNRLLAALPGPHGPTEAVAVGPTLPRILSGRIKVANLPLGPEATRPLPLERPMIEAAFDRLYGGTDALAGAYREGKAAHAELVGALVAEERIADNSLGPPRGTAARGWGAPPPRSFPASARRLAALLRGDPHIRLAFAALGGWDTHVDQGGHKGRLAAHLSPLGAGLAAFALGLGAEWRNTVVVVLSEFGRTLRENDARGTDHGHGNAIWVLGGAVGGGRVYGEWPGLAPGRLYQGRDLAVTTDFRQVLATILERHLRLSDGALAAIFPDPPAAAPGLAKLPA